MDTTDHLQSLGEETLAAEALYLNLKIEKALRAEEFEKDHLFLEAEDLWKEINNEYYSFLNFLQDKQSAAA